MERSKDIIDCFLSFTNKNRFFIIEQRFQFVRDFLKNKNVSYILFSSLKV